MWQISFILHHWSAQKTSRKIFRYLFFTDNAKKRNTSKKKKNRKEHGTRPKNLKNGNRKVSILSDYLHLLEEWKIRYAPKTPEEEWKTEFIEACRQIEKINYNLDLLVFGGLQDRIEFLLDSGKDVKKN